MKVCITGYTGKIGTLLTKKLIESGIEIIGTSRKEQTLFLNSIHHVKVNLSGPGIDFSFLKDVDVLIHLSSITMPNIYSNNITYANNVLSTYNLLDAAARFEIKKVVLSSSIAITGTVYGGFQPENYKISYLPVDENMNFHPIDSYGLSKKTDHLLAEAYGINSKLSIMQVILPWVVMENDLPYIEKNSKLLPGYINLLWGYIHIFDVIDFFTQTIFEKNILKNEGYQDFLLSARDTLSIHPTSYLLDLFFSQISLKSCPEGRESLYCTKKADELLGFKPRYSWQDM